MDYLRHVRPSLASATESDSASSRVAGASIDSSLCVGRQYPIRFGSRRRADDYIFGLTFWRIKHNTILMKCEHWNSQWSHWRVKKSEVMLRVRLSQSQTQVRPQAQPLSGSVPESSHQIIVNSRLAILPASTARASAVAVATRARWMPALGAHWNGWSPMVYSCDYA